MAVCYYLGVERDVGHGSSAIVQVHVELLQGQFLVKELSQVALQQVPTYFLLDCVRPGKPRHVVSRWGSHQGSTKARAFDPEAQQQQQNNNNRDSCEQRRRLH